MTDNRDCLSGVIGGVVKSWYLSYEIVLNFSLSVTCSVLLLGKGFHPFRLKDAIATSKSLRMHKIPYEFVKKMVRRLRRSSQHTTR